MSRWRKSDVIASAKLRIVTNDSQALLADASALKVCVGHASNAGRREVNEDFFGVAAPQMAELASKGVLAAVADGVSGAGGGRDAAEYSVRSLLGDYFATPDTWE